jgi:hypothetical protein
VKALTLWRPWSDAIVLGPKRVENRPWAPPAAMLGKLIAIHAGKRFDSDGAAAIRVVWPDVPNEARSPGGIVGIARIVGYLDLRKEARVVRVAEDAFSRAAARVSSLDQDPFWMGPVGWLLEDVVALSKPVPHPGALGLWRVPPEKEELVLERLR